MAPHPPELRPGLPAGRGLLCDHVGTTSGAQHERPSRMSIADTDPEQFAAKLAQIRAARLYRGIGYKTFGEYVEECCGVSRRAADRLIRRAT